MNAARLARHAAFQILLFLGQHPDFNSALGIASVDGFGIDVAHLVIQGAQAVGGLIIAAGMTTQRSDEFLELPPRIAAICHHVADESIGLSLAHILQNLHRFLISYPSSLLPSDMSPDSLFGSTALLAQL